MTAPGLRERKRLARREELIRAAMRLFSRRGYEETTMEEIAARAEVSPPTLYRYFPTKADLLLGIFWRSRDHNRQKIEDFLAKPALDPIAAVTELICLNNGELRTQGERKLWREVMAALLRTHDRANDEFRAFKAVFEVQIERLVLGLRAAGLLAPELPVATTVLALYAIASEIFYRAIANEFETPAEMRQATENLVRLLLRGWAVTPA